MKTYVPTEKQLWTGRRSGMELYLHEKIVCLDFEKDITIAKENSFGILGYACDEGVRRNHGRPGASSGPDAIRQRIAKLPNHLSDETKLLDLGTISCIDRDMEAAQGHLEQAVYKMLKSNIFPVLLGGGHDIAYGHYNGIKKFLESRKAIGIINFDAHFDLRNNTKGNHSGTPFFQIAKDLQAEDSSFNYMCLGIREDANDKLLFSTAQDLNVTYIKADQFAMHRLEKVKREIRLFMEQADHIYVTIDMDGFSSAYAPGVSAAYPAGFSPDIVMESLKTIIASNKLISIDIAEMNPAFDIDNQTAKLAASLVHLIIHKL